MLEIQVFCDRMLFFVNDLDFKNEVYYIIKDYKCKIKFIMNK